LTGSELAVAVFFHPRISRLEDVVHIRAAQALAKVLGMVMSFWYPLTLLLALAVTIVAHTAWSTPWWLALASTVLFALISVYSVLLPFPSTIRLPAGSQIPCQQIGGICAAAGICFMPSGSFFWLSL
jgi:hypothetical protein